jgi:undecaprenyl-diphosphatase
VDYSLLRTLNGWAYRHAWAAHSCRFLARDGVWLVVAVVVVMFLFAGHLVSLEGRGAASGAGFAMLLALGAGQLISGAVDRARPFVAHPGHVHLLIAHARDAGFPSDHATGSFAIAVALLARHRRAGAIALVLAAAVSFARVAVGAHYPTDVLAGAALGTVAALVIVATPLRRLTDAVGELAGAIYDRLLRAPRLASR